LNPRLYALLIFPGVQSGNLCWFQWCWAAMGNACFWLWDSWGFYAPVSLNYMRFMVMNALCHFAELYSRVKVSCLPYFLCEIAWSRFHYEQSEMQW